MATHRNPWSSVIAFFLVSCVIGAYARISDGPRVQSDGSVALPDARGGWEVSFVDAVTCVRSESGETPEWTLTLPSGW